MILIGFLLQTAGCTTLGYLFHTSKGHLDLMNKRQSIPEVLKQKGISDKKRRQLETVLRIRAFATEELLLPSNKSYTYYVELDREYVTWVIFATPELSLQPVIWCFWIVGCVPYRGYFDQYRAAEFAESLQQQQLDVYTTPVAAYSTLGWFSDPVLSTMLNKGEAATAEYLIHELAHQQLYIKDDTDFNEAFASAVARLGVNRWFRQENRPEILNGYNRHITEKEQIYELIRQLRNRLDKLYQSSLPVPEKRRQKQKAFAQYSDEVNRLLDTWPDGTRYRQWATGALNNAKLNATSTYHELIPDFIDLFARCNEDYQRFYDLVAGLEQVTKSQRQQFLREASCTPTAVSNRGDGD